MMCYEAEMRISNGAEKMMKILRVSQR